MMKFLTNSKCNEQKEDDICDILTLTTHDRHVNITIDPNNVKLLSDDIMGIDFLTLCAVKKSKEEMSSKTVHKMDTTYIPVAKPVKDPFKFVVPDKTILNSLSLVIRNLMNDLQVKQENCKDENIQDDNDHVNIDSDNFLCTIRNQNVSAKEVRFEDILDDSSDSHVTVISCLSQTINKIEKDSVNTSEVPVSNNKDNSEIMTDYARIKLSNNIFDNTKPSIFEDLLNDSFSLSDDDLEVEEVAPNIMPPNPSNILSKNTEDINPAYESAVDIFLDDTSSNDDRSNQNLSVSVEPAKPDQTNKSAENCVDEILDIDFGEDDMTEFMCDKFDNSKPTHNTELEESLLTITQAIEEIARKKKDLNQSPEPSAIKRDSSPEWISSKPTIGVKKKNTRLGLKRLSNINLNSTTKSYTVKQHFLQSDSDEDFIITEDNAKKFNELESSYFCHTSEISKDESNLSHDMTKKSVVNKYFDDTSKSFTTGSSNFCGTSREMKPPDVSKSVIRHPALSLKRNKGPSSNAIDLSVFKASNTCINSRWEQSTSEFDVSTSKQVPHLDRKVAPKISSKYYERKKKKEREKNVYIDDEAQVSSNDSSDESTSITDEDLEDFVSYTQNVENQVDMQAHYLQTSKSPIKRPGAFHFKKPRPPDPNIEIYSQPLSQAQDSYLYVRKISGVHLKIRRQSVDSKMNTTRIYHLMGSSFFSIVGFILRERRRDE